MTRSVRKGPFVDGYLLKKVMVYHETSEKRPIKTWSRRSTITPDFVGVNFAIHNGMKFVPLYVTKEMVGHKLGEFSVTRTFRGHPGSATKVKKG